VEADIKRAAAKWAAVGFGVAVALTALDLLAFDAASSTSFLK
jgi:hypothetical protein